MAKRLSCRDVGVECDFVACADTEEAIFEKAGDHVRKGHGMSEISQELYDKAKSAIREVQEC